jgi:hypothetical protein
VTAEAPEGPQLSDRTIGGTLVFCDWVKRNHYLGASAAEALKSAVKSVFVAVEPETYEGISLDGLDVDQYLQRFRFAKGNPKAETVSVYRARIRRAIEAHLAYLDTGATPRFRQGPGGNGGQPKAKKPTGLKPPKPEADTFDATLPPLSDGTVLTVKGCPKRLAKRDVLRITRYFESLEADEVAGLIPERTGEAAAA